jgi:uncharacterized protein (TIGR02145 family)
MKKSVLLLAGLAFLGCIPQAQTVVDYDGNVYDTVIIGTQVWMKQNLKVTHYNDGVPVPNVPDSAVWVSLTTGARCYYNKDSVAWDSVYGALYNGYTVNDTSNICPAGWHVSTDMEWQTAETYLGGADIAGGKMKEAGSVHWINPNTGATNSSRFTGLPGGMRDPANKFSTMGENGLWWTTTAFNTSFTWSTYFWYQFAGVDHNPTPKKYGLSIRCIRDIASGFADLNYKQIIRIYPNPATSKISIEHNSTQNLQLQVFNMAGECIMQDNLYSQSTEIDIHSLSKGIYAIRIFSDDWSIQKKLIKE